MSHGEQSFLGRTMNEASGQTTDAMNSTAVRGHEINGGQGQMSARQSLLGATRLLIITYRNQTVLRDPRQAQVP